MNMTNEEKAFQLSQEYFPDEDNIWARANIEALKCKSACMEMAQWKDKQVLEKTLKWFQENLQPHTDWTGTRIETRFKCESLDELFNSFKKSIE